MPEVKEHTFYLQPGDIQKVYIDLGKGLQTRLFIVAYESGNGVSVDVVNLDNSKFTARALTWLEGSRKELTIAPTRTMQKQIYCVEINKREDIHEDV